MFSFFPGDGVDEASQFDNLLLAIKDNQKNQILDILMNNPRLATFSDRKNKTVLMYAAESGCDQATFSFILDKGKEMLEEKSAAGETVQSILKNKNNQKLLTTYHEFLNSHQEHQASIS
ncbi:hypothetical protein BN59_02538 [Legionella massiliensis]|uniref:Ankyrin repeats (3 copies) n=1 Tax=Legionella massiliensis TaxID=1034943 RepID=A0A078KUV2_9GAMM|nr:hypothetical protein [Legionella massiliensis]CDZ78230.1 hypothetical protein BN59_02538 [Legionella massiliensis]CEE13968.1 hypothetical protein BN1094_02538 [Legionella massiliensis]